MRTQNTTTGAGTSAAQPIELTYGQVVRGEGFTYAQRITVGTVRGYEAEHGKKYNVQVDPEKAHQLAVERGHEVAWTNQECAVLTADYPGKAEQLAAERAEIAASVILQDGQQVIIEGQTYTVRLVGARYSNPIQFVKVEQPAPLTGRALLDAQLACCKRLEEMEIPIPHYSRMDMMMTLEFAHEDRPLDFAALLASDKSNFLHDMLGMWRHVSRETNKLEDCFVPRFALAA